MTRSRFRLLLVGALVLAVGWFAFWRNGTPRFEPAPCWFKAALAATCGHLVVREVRGDLFSAEIRLPVVRLMPQDGDAPTDPVLFINGGPGGSSGLDEAGIYYWSREISRQPWMRAHEMILMDQRGSGLAAPSLNCPELDAESFHLAYEASDQEQTAWSELEAASDACRDRLIGEGRRLSGYNSVAAAQDIADLQASLGIEALNVYGSSYGTRIALILMRDHAEGLRSVILESVLPPDADFVLQQQSGLPRVIERVAVDCRADAVCAAKYTDLARRFADRLESLDRQPVTIQITDPVAMKTKEIAVTGMALQDVVAHALYGAETIRYMPAFLDRLIEADAVELQRWIQPDVSAWYGGDDMSEGAFYAFFCAEQLPFSNPEEVEAEAARYPAYNGGGIVGSQDIVICERWPIKAVNPRERQPVWSVVPTLLLSGALDPVTPPEFAHRAAKDLVYGYDFVIPKAGHAPLSHSPCANAIAEEFLEQPMERPVAACLTDAR